MGTADYMAPEQAADTHSADIRADIYSLGSTLYRLLSGLPPFPPPQYNTVAKKIIGHARDAAMPVRECRPEVPEELAAYLERMLAKEASDRPATPGEVAEAMTPFAKGTDLRSLVGQARGQESPGIPRTQAGTGTDELLASPRTGTTTDAQRAAARPGGRSLLRRPKLLLAAAGALVLALGAIITIATDRGTLEIRTLDDEVKVEVSRDGGGVTIVDTKTNQTVKLRSGQYEVQITEGREGLSVRPEKFTIRRGQKAIVEVVEVVDGNTPPLPPTRVYIVSPGGFASGDWLNGTMSTAATTSFDGGKTFITYHQMLRNDLNDARNSGDSEQAARIQWKLNHSYDSTNFNNTIFWTTPKGKPRPRP
jgi:hypothetical protein